MQKDSNSNVNSNINSSNDYNKEMAKIYLNVYIKCLNFKSEKEKTNEKYKNIINCDDFKNTYKYFAERITHE